MVYLPNTAIPAYTGHVYSVTFFGDYSTGNPSISITPAAESFFDTTISNYLQNQFFTWSFFGPTIGSSESINFYNVPYFYLYPEGFPIQETVTADVNIRQAFSLSNVLLAGANSNISLVDGIDVSVTAYPCYLGPQPIIFLANSMEAPTLWSAQLPSLYQDLAPSSTASMFVVNTKTSETFEIAFDNTIRPLLFPELVVGTTTIDFTGILQSASYWGQQLSLQPTTLSTSYSLLFGLGSYSVQSYDIEGATSPTSFTVNEVILDRAGLEALNVDFTTNTIFTLYGATMDGEYQQVSISVDISDPSPPYFDAYTYTTLTTSNFLQDTFSATLRYWSMDPGPTLSTLALRNGSQEYELVVYSSSNAIPPPPPPPPPPPAPASNGSSSPMAVVYGLAALIAVLGLLYIGFYISKVV